MQDTILKLGVYIDGNGKLWSYSDYITDITLYRIDGNFSESHNIIQNLIIQNYDLKDKTLFKLKQAKVSRDKIEILKEEYNVSRTIKINKADAIIIPDEFDYNAYNYCLTISHDLLSNVIMMISSITSYRSNNQYNSLFEYYESQKDYIFERCISFVENGDPKIIIDCSSEIYSILRKNNFTDYVNKYVYYDKKVSNRLDYLKLIHVNKPLIKESYVNTLANNNLIVIDDETYNNLNAMCKTEDNVNVAMSIIANCNIEESLEYIVLLYYKYYDKFRECKMYNSVDIRNLKALYLTKLEHIDYNAFNGIARKKNSLKRFILKYKLKYNVKKEAIRYLLKLNNIHIEDFDFEMDNNSTSELIKKNK